MTESNFAIVCDEGCDLSAAFLERAGAVCARLDGGDSGAGASSSLAPAPVSAAEGVGAVAVAGSDHAAGALEECYRGLAARGVTEVVSVHSAACFSPALEGARRAAAACAGDLRVEVVDSGAGSAATGMLVDRASYYRHLGLSLDDAVRGLEGLAAHVRLLVVPASGAPNARRRSRREHAGLLSRATTSLRVRISGERGLYVVTRGEVTQLARSTDLIELTSRLAHAMSAVAANEGALRYALVETGDVRSLRAMEKPLDTNEFEAHCLGTVHAGLDVGRALGTGAVAVALAPAAAYDHVPGADGSAETRGRAGASVSFSEAAGHETPAPQRDPAVPTDSAK